MIITRLSHEHNYIHVISEWFHKQWGYLYPERNLQDIKNELSKHLANQTIPATYLALDNNQVIGTAAIVNNDMEIREEYWPWLASVYVDHNFRRRGVGEKLIQKICDHAREKLIKNIYLFTPDQESWYKKLGWEFIERINYHNDDVCVMKKIL